MHHIDVSIFDTERNTIRSVATLINGMEPYNKQDAMIRNGQVVALVEDYENRRLNLVSYTIGEPKVHEIKDLGSYKPFWFDH